MSYGEPTVDVHRQEWENKPAEASGPVLRHLDRCDALLRELQGALETLEVRISGVLHGADPPAPDRGLTEIAALQSPLADRLENLVGHLRSRLAHVVGLVDRVDL